MKKLLAIASCFIFWTQMAFSPSQTEDLPLLEKTIHPGFAPIEYSRFMACDIYEDRIEVTRGVGEIYTKSVYPILLQGNIKALIKAASKGEIVSEIAPTDLPVTTYRGFQAEQEVKLLSKGSVIYSNRANQAQYLVNFIDINCGSLRY